MTEDSGAPTLRIQRVYDQFLAAERYLSALEEVTEEEVTKLLRQACA
jgi:predicted phosphoribosyltransferase